MIQRKQTLFLLLSAVLMALMPFLSVGRVTTPQMLYTMTGFGMEDIAGELVEPAWALAIFGIAIMVISLVTIFLYKKRVAQMRLTIFNLILKLGYIGLVVLNLYRFAEVQKPLEAEWGISVWLALPLVAAIFDYLAHRGILADHTLIRMMDRLR